MGQISSDELEIIRQEAKKPKKKKIIKINVLKPNSHTNVPTSVVLNLFVWMQYEGILIINWIYKDI